jgi:hypothetical protein
MLLCLRIRMEWELWQLKRIFLIGSPVFVDDEEPVGQRYRDRRSRRVSQRRSASVGACSKIASGARCNLRDVRATFGPLTQNEAQNRRSSLGRDCRSLDYQSWTMNAKRPSSIGRMGALSLRVHPSLVELSAFFTDTSA